MPHREAFYLISESFLRTNAVNQTTSVCCQKTLFSTCVPYMCCRFLFWAIFMFSLLHVNSEVIGQQKTRWKLYERPSHLSWRLWKCWVYSSPPRYHIVSCWSFLSLYQTAQFFMWAPKQAANFADHLSWFDGKNANVLIVPENLKAPSEP